MSLHDYINQFSQAMSRQNSAKLKALLTINPPGTQGTERAKFPDPSDIDLYSIPEKFHPVIRAYFSAMRSIYINSDIHASFYALNDLVVAMNRAAETQSNWVCPALINSSDELISLYQVRAKSRSKESPTQKPEHPTDSLELVAATVNKSFKVCLTDKTYDFALSKKASIHFFLAALIKIYFKLNKLELAKSVEKALTGTGLALPTIVNSPVEYRRHTITYLYFSALLSLDEGGFAAAEAKLLAAMEFLSCYKNQAKVAGQTEKILLLLVPLKFYSSRAALPDATAARFPSLDYIYRRNLLRAVETGDIRQFETCVRQFQKIFLKRHIYVLIVNLRHLCHLRLVQRTARIYAELNKTSAHIVPFSAIQLALEFSGHHSESPEGLVAPESLATQHYSASVEEVECILANLIQKKWVKGYLSHANRCIVLSKTDAFPRAPEKTA